MPKKNLLLTTTLGILAPSALAIAPMHQGPAAAATIGVTAPAGAEGGLGGPVATELGTTPSWMVHGPLVRVKKDKHRYGRGEGAEGGEGGEGGEGRHRHIYVAPFPLPYQPAACPPTIVPRSLSNSTIGIILGGTAGGLLGSQIGKGDRRLVAIGVGTVLGALIGREVGRSLDRTDQVLAVAAEHQALSGPPGCRVGWRNPENGHLGDVRLLRDYDDPGRGGYCREYQTTVRIDGRRESAYGLACRRRDGSWQIVNR